MHDTENVIVELNCTFLEEYQWLEAVADISKVQDAYWETELPTKEEIQNNIKKAPNLAIFRFNVLGDGCGENANRDNPCDCEKPPHTGISTCYKVVFSGYPDDGVRVSFSRGVGREQFSDVRLSYEEDGKKIPVGANVFLGVKMALKEYLQKLNPVSIDWEATTRSTFGVGTIKRTLMVDRNVRDSIYNIWSAKNLFPNKFVGIQGYWIKREIYNNVFVPMGFPEVPNTVTYMITDKSGNRIQKTESLKEDSSASAKIAAMKQMNNQIEKMSNWYNKIRRFRINLKSENEKTRREDYEGSRRKETADLGLERSKTEKFNPDKLKIDDVVKFKSAIGVNFYINAIIKSFHAKRYDSKLYVEVQFQSDPSTNKFDGEIKQLPVDEFVFVKSFENDIKYYKNLLFEKSKEHNVRTGDKIIFNAKAPNTENKLLGSIQKLFLYRNVDGSANLKAKVLWDDHAKSVLKNKQNNLFFISDLEKVDPQTELNIKNAQRHYGIRKRIDKNKRRLSAIKLRNDLEARNFDLKIGDKVKVVSGMYNGKVGKILLFQKSNSGLIVQLASPEIPNFRVKAEYLEKIPEDISMTGNTPASANENTFAKWLSRK